MATTTNVFMVVLFLMLVVASAQNITKILAAEPQFSTLNKLLSETGVAEEINSRKSLTVLAPDNSVLDPIVANLGPKISTQQLADILRYHCLLQYFDIPELHQIIKGTTQVTTLYQTTGRAPGTLGFVNITDAKGGSLVVSTPVAANLSHATIVKSVKQIPYNLSIFELSSVIVPVGVLTQTPPPTPAPVLSPVKAPAPGPSPTLSPVPIASPVPTPAATPVPITAPTPSPAAAPVPTAVPTPTATPVKAPISSPPAPPTEVPSAVLQTPSSPSKSSAFYCAISPLFINVSLFLGLALTFPLQL
ncbi:hypothetical protein O6H91_08G002300 [Diphasiastrum complanatum]|uniref:Uncharacterized protein n=1 Tax=Diphasiastrum complanatum TaxID=34168 RepID=A0ACC2CUF7_DIPCM|nr:hypothetical protein O6H91_08G002300 [Diphasiastrum complanatum]